MKAHPAPPVEFANAIVNTRWLLLNRYGCCRSDASVPGDARTVAESCTSTGCPIRVSFGLASPPASSFLNYTWLGDGPPDGDRSNPPKVIAAHGDCLLFELSTPHLNPELDLFSNLDY